MMKFLTRLRYIITNVECEGSEVTLSQCEYSINYTALQSDSPCGVVCAGDTMQNIYIFDYNLHLYNYVCVCLCVFVCVRVYMFMLVNVLCVCVRACVK